MLIAGWSFTNLCNLRCKHCYNNSGKKKDDEITTKEALKSGIDKKALELFKKLPISEPNVTFLLESSFETIEDRIKKRVLKSKVDSSVKRESVEKLGKIYRELEKYNNAVIIDTTNINEKEVTDIALVKIKEYAGV